MSATRKLRRAAEHAARKASRKTGFAVPVPQSEPGRPFPTLAEIAPVPLDANRAASSQERTVRGLTRHNGPFKPLTSEDPIGFEALKRSLAEEHEPATETECILVNVMAESHWLSQRALRLQDACFDPDSGQITDPKLFSLYLRCQTTHSRAFHKSLNDLLKLRAESRKSEIGFEAQRVKTERHEMKKQGHYWEILRKDAQAVHQISLNTHEYLKGLNEHPGFKAQYEVELAKHGLKQGEATVAVTETAA